MTTNVMLRDLDMVLPNAADGRLLEVVAQLAVDTTLVCALRRDGKPTRNAADEDGVLNSPKHALVARTNCYANGKSRHCASDGFHCWPARRPKQWQSACWSTEAPVGLMEQLLRLMRSNATFATLG